MCRCQYPVRGGQLRLSRSVHYDAGSGFRKMVCNGLRESNGGIVNAGRVAVLHPSRRLHPPRHVTPSRNRIKRFRAHDLPPVYSGAEIEILGHTVDSNVTTVQLKCSNCTTWPTGNLNIKSTSADFIYAYGTTAPASPANSGSSFLQHVSNGGFTLNLVSAQSSSTTAPTLTGSKSSSSEGGGLTERQWVPIIRF
jgi:Cytochrome domain of cellobiose dehydrogenase